MTTHIMVDLETLGTNPNSPIIAIGATDGTKIFYGKIKLKDIVGSISPDTVEWWLQQSPEAIQETFFSKNNLHTSFIFLLLEFSSWLSEVIKEAGEDYKIYSNGVDFDLVMLKETYRDHNWDLPWNSRKQMCYRTLKNQFPLIVLDDTEVAGIKHTALADAQYQHRHLIRILNHIENMEEYYSADFRS